MPVAPELGNGGLGNGGASAEPALAPDIGTGICSVPWLAELEAYLAASGLFNYIKHLGHAGATPTW